MEMHGAFVQGSRRSFTFTVPSTTRPTEQTAAPSNNSSDGQPRPISKIQRKQLRTFQSPSAQGTHELRIEKATNAARAVASDNSSSSSTASGTSDPYAHINTNHVHKPGPALSLYHPRGRLALALPDLDPSLFGLPGSVNIEDHDVRMHVALQDADGSQRSSSRARRPAAKLREGVGANAGVGEEEEANDVSSAANGRKPPTADVQGQTRPVSPRKRRSGGSGLAGGGGGKRRRKEADEDGTYPNPVSRRTRNPRGVAAAVASPLTGPAVVAEAGPDEAEGEGDGDGEDANAPGETAEAQVTRSTRSRRSRVPAPKRRGSSASETTTTSVSISIAANARSTRSTVSKKQPEADTAVDVEMALPSRLGEDKIDDATSAEQASNTSEVDGSRVPAQKEDVARSPPADVSMEVEPTEHTKAETPAVAEVATSEVAPQEMIAADVEPSVNSVGSASSENLQSSNKEDIPVPAAPKKEEAKMDLDVPDKVDLPIAVQKAPAKQLIAPVVKPPTPPKPAPTSSRHEAPARPAPPIMPSRMRIEDDEKEEGELSEE